MPPARLILVALPVAFAAVPAEAYIGPGAGAGTIAVVLGVLAAVAMAFMAIVWYPVKRLLKRAKRAPAARPGGDAAGDGAPEPAP